MDFERWQEKFMCVTPRTVLVEALRTLYSASQYLTSLVCLLGPLVPWGLNKCVVDF